MNPSAQIFPVRSHRFPFLFDSLADCYYSKEGDKDKRKYGERKEQLVNAPLRGKIIVRLKQSRFNSNRHFSYESTLII